MGQEGNSLISVMIGIGLMGFLALAITKLSSTTNTIESQSKATFNWTQTLSIAQKALSNPEFCTANFEGKIFPNSGNLPINLFQNDGATLSTKSFLVKGQKFDGISIADIKLVKHSDLSDLSKLGNLNITILKTVGKRTNLQTYPIPITFEVEKNTNKIITCSRGISVDSGKELNSQICHLSSNGLQIYDPKSDTCIPLEIETCYEGTRRTSSCPAGGRAASCGAVGINDQFDTTLDRAIEGGRVSTSKPNPFVTAISSSSCECFYATSEADTSNARCRVCCATPNPDVAGLIQ